MSSYSNRHVRGAMAGLAALVFSSGIALADAIDGDWCNGAQSLNIQGPRIRTPGGTEMTGDYTRHTFDYVVPANEPGAGGPIAMRLLSEEAMNLLRGPATATPEVWRRCKPVS